MSTPIDIFNASKKEQEIIKAKRIKNNDRDQKTKNRYTIQSAKYTIRSLPKQIANSRLNNPGQLWIRIKPKYFWGLFAENSTDIDYDKFVEIMKEKGFDVCLIAPNQIAIKDPDVCIETYEKPEVIL